jgi:hypothetical protein
LKSRKYTLLFRICGEKRRRTGGPKLAKLVKVYPTVSAVSRRLAQHRIGLSPYVILRQTVSHHNPAPLIDFGLELSTPRGFPGSERRGAVTLSMVEDRSVDSLFFEYFEIAVWSCAVSLHREAEADS